MDKKNLTRRQLLATASAGTLAAVSRSIPAYANISNKGRKLAILGGEPVRKNKPWPRWPYWDEKVIDSVVKTTKSRIWCRIQSRSGTVPTFEKKFARLMGTKFCVATGSGTQALHT
ncbi:MAG: DegT/DnrJ/EryC1/StrS family aminotransferase, partial [Phycisphaerae bacterium]|nr:DegT/DnrJ/EryC1/StrS family aminotransferase [Phycisphaerae bacterium]NIP54379.1 DegT/DnrJ/EryC1/StrS family aminotransferase [Phycisphaerae bacterium]NIS53238.1 DegT/DnrJ/EryC1/StrS family aminotransferase [Phycisphaerae bacterium]NIU10763.1 DegT/DnrJ/EryC1/StrS family aminotransferase [Phycisphaerae bacterium]NIU57998.1 DegT/DnrJ/EryC1/StrS family aminotransferase [Phycisphaerae bacterium]